ncbi:hypothetical protein SL055_002360 [Flavobacterium psychrophilum]|nr:hypothetical protein [Flavobacterium psychrophilum]
MKAIHNRMGDVATQCNVGNYKLKYNFESNSQPIDERGERLKVGNYKLKYNFESNSQPESSSPENLVCW